MSSMSSESGLTPICGTGRSAVFGEIFGPSLQLRFALLAGFVFHSVSVERLAQSRARELNDAYVRQREIEDKALKTEERLAALSRLQGCESAFFDICA